MKFYLDKYWQFGLCIVLFAFFCMELLESIRPYMVHRFGLNKDLVLMLLWSSVFFASFLSTTFSKMKFPIVSGSSFIFIAPFLKLLFDSLGGGFSENSDFQGLGGAFVVLKIYFLICFVLGIIGVTFGLLVSNKS